MRAQGKVVDRSHNSMVAVEVAIESAVENYRASNPSSASLHEAAHGSMPGGNTRTALHFEPFPLYIQKSEGAFVTDTDGHRYLDVLGEFTAGIFGHSDPHIAKAVADTLEAGMSNGAPGAAEIELSNILTSRFPSVEKIRFCNTGTEANLYALTLAKIFTKRQKILVFNEAYHGGVFVFGGGGSTMNVPFDWIIARYNELDRTRDQIRENASELAAVIIEPMMSNGGCIPADTEFLQMLREECSDCGALLVFDEVVSSRMGAGGIQRRTNILPDLTTLGKYMGAGFSFGAFGGRADVLELMNPSNQNALPHAGTYNNNVFSMRAGTVAMRDVFTPERAEILFDAGEKLRARLNEICTEFSDNVQFTGLGSTMNIHFYGGQIKSPEDLHSENTAFKQLFQLHLISEGIYIARRGQITLSLPMNDKHFNAIASSLRSFMRTYAHLIPAGS